MHLQVNGKKRRPVAEINVVPYIDVMLVLLIIFMVTAPMLVQTVPVELPKVESSPTEISPENKYLIINITNKGEYFIEQDEAELKPVAEKDIIIYVQKLVRQVPNTQIMIRADKNVAYGRVVVLMGELQNSGLSHVGLITEAPDAKVK